MIRSDTIVASTLSALLVLGACGAASAQSAQPDPSPSTPGQDQPKSSQGSQGNKGAGQEKFDRDKMALKERVQEQIDAADAHVDTLKKMSENEKGSTKKQHQDMEKQLSDSRDRLKKDMGKIDRSTMDDWNSVHPAVERDVMATNTQLQRVASVTKLPVPQTGAANKQP